MGLKGFKIQRWVALLAALGVGAVLAGAILYRHALAAEYHFYLLKRDPGHLSEVLERPEGTAERKAVLRFLATSEGKERLFQEYLGEVKRWNPDLAVAGVGLVKTNAIIRLQERSLKIVSNEGSFEGSFMAAESSLIRRRRAILALSSAILEREFLDPEFPGLRFKLLPAGSDLPDPDVLLTEPPGQSVDPATPICVVQRVPDP